MSASEQQASAMRLAHEEGYVRPASATHAKRCATTPGRLLATCKACAKRGWLKAEHSGRFTLTPDGARELLKQGEPEQATTPSAAGEDWAF